MKNTVKYWYINDLGCYEHILVLWVVMGVYKCPVASACNPHASPCNHHQEFLFKNSLYSFTIFNTNGK